MRRPFLLAAAFLAPLAAAEAREPPPEVKARIEAALREQGYTGWEEIELKRNGRIEVDDARAADGKEYDLELDPQTFQVTKREED